MSSTVWLKFRNSASGRDLLLEDDLIAFTRSYPDWAGICQAAGVIDLNDFVDYGESLAEFADDLPEDFQGETFTFLPLSELQRSLQAVAAAADTVEGKAAVTGKALEEVRAMLGQCASFAGTYDQVGLTYIA